MTTATEDVPLEPAKPEPTEPTPPPPPEQEAPKELSKEEIAAARLKLAT